MDRKRQTWKHALRVLLGTLRNSRLIQTGRHQTKLGPNPQAATCFSKKNFVTLHCIPARGELLGFDYGPDHWQCLYFRHCYVKLQNEVPDVCAAFQVLHGYKIQSCCMEPQELGLDS